MSWVASTYLGAMQLGKPQVMNWSGPWFEAFVAGCWSIAWTPDTLYWAAKPVLHKDPTGGRRLHNSVGPALESEIENLYFIRGVMVPAFVVVRPDWITLKHIDSEDNVEVRRMMIERFGTERFLRDGGSKEIDRDDFGVLYRREIPGDEPLVMVKVVNSTPEPDGTFKDYFLRVPPQITKARQAVAWTFELEEGDYKPAIQT